MNNRQVLVIGGGNVYKNEEGYLNDLKNREVSFAKDYSDWKKHLQSELGENYEVLRPLMPLKHNAKYKYWEIVFNKIIPVLDKDCIVVAHSLGSSFLIKYLISNPNFKLNKIIFLSPVFSSDDIYEFKSEPDFVKEIANQINDIVIYHSKDDLVVPVTESKLLHNILPNSRLQLFEGYGHFFGFDKFPEIIEEIKSS